MASSMRKPRQAPGRRKASSEVMQRIQNRVLWALLLSGIAAGLYAFNGKQASLTKPLVSPNVRSLNAAAAPGCNIKGNISTRGERIYHVPGQTYYAVTRINPSRVERWFCSEWRAWLTGWRKAKL